MQDSSVRIELRQDGVEKATVAEFVSSEGGVGDEVGELDQARCSRVHEQRNFGEVLEAPPATSIDSKVSRQGLKGTLVL